MKGMVYKCTADTKWELCLQISDTGHISFGYSFKR